MIRLFIFVFFRFFITVIAIYLALTLLKKVIRTFQGYSTPPPRRPQKGNHLKTKDEYKDVKDANFTELPNKQTEDNQDSTG